MKLLIITQVLDTEHPILGFFHRWVEEFAKHCEQVHVICLQEGRHDLPDNVTVHSLGKESHQTGGATLKRTEGTGKVVPRVLSRLITKLTYILRFYKLIWQLRHEYDG
ncbi:MAG: hypothetical protein LR008_03730, partial [Candidatus Pacebacteria bacterium]|nr:hypothetical protein [Candidatus Paceibacterota bacterium]